MKRAECWSSQEIETLKYGFLRGTPFKILSQELGRSPSALNKALSRFKIRQKTRRMTTKTFYRKEIPEKKLKRNFFNSSVETSLEHIIFYLQNHGYAICGKTIVWGDKKITRYFFNQRPISPIRLLIIANSIRLDEKQPIFISQKIQIQN